MSIINIRIIIIIILLLNISSMSIILQCNKKRIMDYPNIWGYLRDLYQTKGFGDTTDRYHIENHYQVKCQRIA